MTDQAQGEMPSMGETPSPGELPIPGEKSSPGEKPALTIVIQSWWTPALAVIMLVIGLLAGYFGRPLVNRSADTAGNVAAVTTPSATLVANQNPAVTTSVDPTLAAINSAEQAMAYLISRTSHFQGDANAKVTIIEFSDYQ